mmetsp:Transcript_34127/g.106182  ORF Transcript_34127/g.106182 Transcript_34127/m.106182 type:complete len:385 (-) Transcript_34127:16-1170(-)
MDSATWAAATGDHIARSWSGLPVRVQVRCVASAGDGEEVIVVPLVLAYTSNWTVADLLQLVRERVQRVPAEDVEELELDCSGGGRLHEEDTLEAVLRDGDVLRSSAGVRRSSRMPLASITVPEAAAGSRSDAWARRSRLSVSPAAPASYAELEAGYARVFGAGLGSEQAEESDESPTPPAPGVHCTRSGQSAGAGCASCTSSHAHTSTSWRRQASSSSGLRSRSPPLRTRCTLAPGGQDGKWPPLLRAVYDGDEQMVKDLLRGGADVNCTMTGAGQKTPIYYAIRFDNAGLVQLLLRQPGVDVHRKMRSGRAGSWTTPLEAAREAGPGTGVHRAFVAHGLLPAAADEPAKRDASLGWGALPQLPARRATYAGMTLSARRSGYGR